MWADRTGKVLGKVNAPLDSDPANPALAPDGLRLAFNGTLQSNVDVRLVDQRGVANRDVEGQFSPDGNWIAYASNESGRDEIYVRPFPSPGGKWQVSSMGGTQPRWGPKGNELYYVSPDNRLMSTPIRVLPDTRAIEPGTPVSLLPVHLAAGANVSAGSNTARAQYVVAPDGRFLMVRSVDEAVGAPITIVLNWTAAAIKK